MTQVVLGLGSNCGESVSYFRHAVESLEKEIHQMKMSSIYKTKPMEYLQQDDFYNMVIAGMYSGTAEHLLDAVLDIENVNLRDRSSEIRYGPRTLDIDVELFGNSVIDTPRLQVPHPRMKNRQFVLIPLLEILPQLSDPLTGRLFQDICAALPDQGVRKAGTLYGS